MHICLTAKARMSQTRRSQKCALIRASTIARLVGEPTLPRKRRAPARLEVGVGAPELFPQTAKDHFKEGFITRLLILSSVLSISALIRKASAPTPRWRLSWLKLLMVTTVRQSSRFLKHHKAKMLIACERQTFLLAHRPRRSSSRNVPQRR